MRANRIQPRLADLEGLRNRAHEARNGEEFCPPRIRRPEPFRRAPSPEPLKEWLGTR